MYLSCRSAQAKPFDLRRTVRFVLAAVVFARVPSELPTLGGPAAAPCEAASLRVVRLVVVNEAGVAAAVLDAAAWEAGAIWAGAGVRLTWTFAPTSFERMGADTVVVVIRRALRTPPVSGSSEPSASHALGRISLRRRWAARQHDRGLARCADGARDGGRAVRSADSEAAPREPAGPDGPWPRTCGGSRAGALARRTRPRAGRRHEGGFRRSRPRRVDHAAVAARMETLAAGALGRAARGARRLPEVGQGGAKGPMPPHTGGTGR